MTACVGWGEEAADRRPRGVPGSLAGFPSSGRVPLLRSAGVRGV